MIIRNISYGLSSNIVRLVFGLTIFTLLTKFLSIEDFGIYAYITVVTGYVTVFMDFGFNFSTLYEVPKQKHLMKNIFFETIFSKFLLLLFSVIPAFVFIKYTDGINSFLLIVLFLLIAIFFSFSSYLIQVFKAFDRFDIDLYFSLINNGITLILIYFFRKDLTLVKLGFILLIARFVGLVFVSVYFKLFFVAIKIIDNLNLNLNLILKNLKYAIHMIFGSIFLSVDIIIMKEVLSFEDIAIYSAGIKILMSVLIIGEVMNSSFMPKLSESINRKPDLFKRLVSKLFLLMLSFSLIFSLLLYCFGAFGLALIFDNKYNELVELLPYFCFAIIIRYLAIFFGTLVTVANKQKYRAFTVIFILPFHIILNYFLQIEIGVKGAVLSLCVSFFIITIINVLISRKYYSTLVLNRNNNN